MVVTRTHEWLSSRLVEWAHRSRALPPMRLTASWSRSFGSTEYKYVARGSAPVGERASDRPRHRLQHRYAETQRTALPRLPLDGDIPIQVMGHRPAFTGLERQARLRAVERLDLALLVDRDDHRVLGRVHVETDDVLDLLGELRIIGALEGANAVRLQPMRHPQALHGAQAHADGFGHGTAGPMGGVARRLGAGQVHNLGDDPGRKRSAAG